APGRRGHRRLGRRLCPGAALAPGLGRQAPLTTPGGRRTSRQARRRLPDPAPLQPRSTKGRTHMEAHIAAALVPLLGWAVHGSVLTHRLASARRDPLTGLHTRAGWT